MNKSEYDQKKRECWEEFWDEISGNIDFAPGVDDRMKEHIYDTFDRAYALGKEKETITQAVIERAAEKYADGLKVSSAIPGVIVPMLHDIAKDSYICGAQDTLGKQEKDTADSVIQGWVARYDAGPEI